MNESYKNYLKWLQLNCENPATLHTYSYRINHFYKNFKEMNQDNIDSYFLNMIKQKQSASSFNLTRQCFLNYFKFSKQSFTLPKNRKKDKRIQKYFAKEEIIELISQLMYIFPQVHNKVEVLIKFLFITGIRPGELMRLKRENFDLDKGILELVDTKGNKDRLIPLGIKTRTMLRDYFAIEHEKINAFNITAMNLKKIFEKITQNMGYKMNMNTRLLRHSAGVNFVRDGMDAFSIKNIFGHSDIAMTEIYAEPNFKHTKEIFNKRVKEI